MHVLVTGAGGYVGRYLIKRLENEGGSRTQIFSILRSQDRDFISAKKNEVLFCDLSQFESVKNALKDIKKIDVVYHLAAVTSGSHFEAMMGTVIGTKNLLYGLADKKVRRFVLVSSFSVYKMTTLLPWAVLDETCPMEDNLTLRDSYSITKTRQEKLVNKICYELKIPVVVVRPGKIYGSYSYPIPPQLGLNIPGLFFLYMGGSHLIPLTYVENVAYAIHLAGIVENIDGEVFNVVDDDLPTQKQFLKQYKRYMGKIPRTIKVPDSVFHVIVRIFEFATRITKGNIPPVLTRYRAENLWKPLLYDNTHIKKRLGWTPIISTQQGLKRMFTNE